MIFHKELLVSSTLTETGLETLELKMGIIIFILHDNFPPFNFASFQFILLTVARINFLTCQPDYVIS